MFRLLQGVFASMGLERKILLFFGSSLVPLMCAAFWVVQVLAGQLVLKNTLQVASDYGKMKLLRAHSDGVYSERMDSELAAEAKERIDLIENRLLRPGAHYNPSDDYQYQIVGLKEEVPFSNLPAVTPPERGEEHLLLLQLEKKYRQQLTNIIASTSPDLLRPMELSEKHAFSQQIVPGHMPLFERRGPVNDRFLYYAPVFFDAVCTASCHMPSGNSIAFTGEDPERLAEQYPFRVIKVSMPYQATYEATAWIRAVVIAVAMLIIAVTLFVLHAIVRYLVLKPLYHLREVSDAITHGDTGLRASIDTEDEFRELADAFNRMLRHLTETQDQIQEVNRELDRRVDQLAQLNLQLYEANRLKSDFLANMSHELRTPLNSIIGFSDVLQGIESLSEKQRRYAANIQKSGRLLLEMINDILDLAKVEAGKMEVRRTRFHLGALVHAQADMVRSLSEEKNIQLTVQVPANLPPVEQDQCKLGQILTNLLSNAIKFTPDGGMIRVAAQDLGDGRFELAVADTGVGIAEEDHAIIFEKFRQSRKVLDGEGLTREFAGTGLGLSIVKELTKLLGGEVSFESELGRGSTFRVVLPWILPSRPADAGVRETTPSLAVPSATAPDSSPGGVEAAPAKG